MEDLAMMPYFPVESRAAIQDFLARICPHKEALKWLVGEAINNVDRWPGPAGLRGLLCTRYDARDGIDAYCNLPGYTPAEMEARHLERHEQLKADGWVDEKEFQKLAVEGVKLKQLGAAKKGA